MPATLELGDVRILPTGERQMPDPQDNRLLFSEGTIAPPVVTAIHQEGPQTTRSATPATLLLGTLSHPRLRLLRPLRMSISREEAFVVVSVPELEEFGYGPHLTAAIDDLRHSLVELYLRLEEDQPRLGPDLVQLWKQLHQLIQPR